MTTDARSFLLRLENREQPIQIAAQGLQTILIKAENI